MTRTIKRYANRKLYDFNTKRYITLEDLGKFVKAGEEVQVIDNETGADITSIALSKVVSEVISENGDKEKWVPAELLSEMIRKPSDAVVDYVKQGIAVGVRTVKGMEEQLQQRWKQVTTRNHTGNGSATDDLKLILQRMVEESVQFLITKMNLPTRTEINELNLRLDEIERQLGLPKQHKARGRKKSVR